MTYVIPSSEADLLSWAIQLVQQLEEERNSAISGFGAGGSNIPAGTMAQFGGTTAPDGWIACEGQLLTIEAFPNLYSAIGTRWNLSGDPVDMFRLPDARGRFARGLETGADLFGGEASFTLGIENLPAIEATVTDPGHTHTFTGAPHTHSYNDPQHNHEVSGSPFFGGGEVSVAAGSIPIQTGAASPIVVQNSPVGITIQNATAGGSNASSETNIAVTIEGGGQAVKIEPPYISLMWIIKT